MNSAIYRKWKGQQRTKMNISRDERECTIQPLEAGVGGSRNLSPSNRQALGDKSKEVRGGVESTS